MVSKARDANTSGGRPNRLAKRERKFVQAGSSRAGSKGNTASIRSAAAPAHFQARYGEFEATIHISTLEAIQGELPRRALNLVQEWAMIHREELLEAWLFFRENRAPAKIDPLA